MIVQCNGIVIVDVDVGNVCRGFIKWIFVVGDINIVVNFNVVIIICYVQVNNVQVLFVGGGQIVVINIQCVIKGNGIVVIVDDNVG